MSQSGHHYCVNMDGTVQSTFPLRMYLLGQSSSGLCEEVMQTNLIKKSIRIYWIRFPSVLSGEDTQLLKGRVSLLPILHSNTRGTLHECSYIDAGLGDLYIIVYIYGTELYSDLYMHN